MKFRVSPKDLIMFVIYSIFLLILCSLAVVNLSSLLNEGKLYGFNFFAGLFPPYLPATLFVFIAVIVSIFFSVSSYIFDHEKGSGIGLKIGEKEEEKGYTRFTTDKEMKNADDVKKVVSFSNNGNAFKFARNILSKNIMFCFQAFLNSIKISN